MSFKTISQPNLPKFMIISIKDDTLYISKAGMRGGFKGSFSTIRLEHLIYEKEERRFSISSYYFKINLGEGNTLPFILNISNSSRAERVIEFIKSSISK